MTVCFHTSSYTASSIIIFLDDCCISFARSTIIVPSVPVTYNSILVTVWHDILLIYSALDTEDTWMEAVYYWLFVVNSVGLREGRFFFSEAFHDDVAS